MNIAFELDEHFLEREGIRLSADDLKFGFEHGWLRPSTIIGWASREVARGDEDRTMVELASLLRTDEDDVPSVLAQLDSPDHIHDPRETSRKWLYLELKAAFERRNDLADPLGVVEEIYADFEYPPSVTGFVRYMPVDPGDEQGESGLLKRWAAYLSAESVALKREPT